MEEKINIAEILKNKPQGIKLYDLLRNIDVELDKVHTTNVGTYIECTSTNDVGSTLLFDYSELGTEKCWLDGLQILLPSKGMRDWEKFTSKWWKWIKRASYSLFHYNKNVEQQKLIKRCINEMSSVLLGNLYGYWRGDLSDYLKNRDNLEYFMRRYKDDAYRHIMEWLDEKK